MLTSPSALSRTKEALRSQGLFFGQGLTVS